MSSTSYMTGSTAEAYPSQHVPNTGVAEQSVLTAAHQAFCCFGSASRPRRSCSAWTSSSTGE
jgi:hypothetical protein